MSRSRGYSLIELIVVIAIIGILLGLVLGGIQRVRSAAARTACQNQMRQLGLALHQHHDAHGAFPMGISNEGGRLLSPETKPIAQPFVSWLVRILPYVEQDALYQQAETAFRADKNYHSAAHNSVRAQSLKVYHCPSDGNVSQPYTRAGSVYGMTSYLGVEGYNLNQLNGVLYMDSMTTFASITDGTSNTLAIGERPPVRHPPERPGSFDFGYQECGYGMWYAGSGQDRTGSVGTVLGVREFGWEPTMASYCNETLTTGGVRLPEYPFQMGDPAKICSLLHFWSYHPSGANFTFADGSVRFLRYSVNPLMPALASRAGRETVALD
jgi:prepilin-type N-terminal cleavage/methylation domain-containing protein/prepilin-type processing-associated H-X9-DG protein